MKVSRSLKIISHRGPTTLAYDGFICGHLASWTILTIVQNNGKPWVIVGLVVSVLVYNCLIAWREATAPEFLSVLYLGLSAFVGSYVALDGQGQQPSPWMAAGLIAALLISFGAAISVVFRLSRTGIARMSTARRTGGVVIIGSSAEADAIARSLDDEARKSLIRIHEVGPADERGTLLIPNWQRVQDDPLAAKAIRASSCVIVAASTDAVSARLAAAMRPLTAPLRPYQLVRSTDLAGALRPSVLTAFPEAEGFHPSDNVGQLVASVVGSQARDRNEALRVGFKACGATPTADSTLVWLSNVSAATGFVENEPSFVVVAAGEDADLLVLAGLPEQVAAEAARQAGEHAIVAVVSADLFGPVALPERSRVLRFESITDVPLSPGDVVVIDPEGDGLNYHVVTDGLDAQWGRAFDDAYTSLYVSANPGEHGSGWTIGNRGRAEQSSIAAAKYMLTVLREHGYELRSGNQFGWMDGMPSFEVLDRMARREHEDWWQQRTWTDADGAHRQVSLRQDDEGNWRDGPNSVEFDELSPETQAYNRDVVAKVYPALAAMFGYGIRRSQPASGA